MSLRKKTLAALLAACAATSLFAQAKPNVLLIIVDDLSAAAIGHPAFGRTHPSVQTPNIDRLANEGVSFTQAYANWPSCAPARQAFMSGALAEKTQYRFYGNVREEAGRNRSLVYMGEHFKNNGYSTLRLDKVYHIGRDVAHQWDVTEEPFGATYKDVVQQAREFTELGLVDADTVRKVKFSEMAGEDSEIIELKAAKANGTPITANTLTDGRTKLRALQYLDDLAAPGGQFDAAQKPFFMAVGFRRPHLPFMAPTSYYGRFRWGAGDTNVTDPATPAIVLPPQNQAFTNVNEYRQALEGYYACLAMTDDHIGEILNKLDQTGLASNTIVVFFGDHGYGLGEKNKFFAKGTQVNPGFHTPLIFRVPNGKRINEAENKAVTLIDVYPTVSDLAGLPRPATPLDGSSLVPLLEKSDPDWVENAIAFVGDNDDATLPLARFVWAEGYKYYENEAGSPSELFQVGAGDRFEFTNLLASPAHSAARTRLKQRMDSLMARSLSRIAPDVSQQPPTQVVAAGSTALFTVNTASPVPYTAQWYRNGVLLPGETSTSLLIPNAQVANAGNYSCILLNENGRTFSYQAELRVLTSINQIFDWQIDDRHAPYILDGINGAPFESIDSLGSAKFSNTLSTTYYSQRAGYAYVRPVLPFGSYRVYTHGPSWSGGASAVTHEVRHLAGSTSTVVNQADTVRGWELLGTYNLGPRSDMRVLTLTNQPGTKYPALDGARFERLSAPANAIPVALDDGALTTAPDTAVGVNVLANDSDSDAGDTLSIFQVSGSTLGTVTTVGGTVTFTPFKGVVSGTSTIRYQATDGKHLSNPASFTVTIVQPPGTETITASTNGGGTVAWASTNPSVVPTGTSVTFTPSAYPGYQFYHWEGTSAPASLEGDEAVASPLTIAVDDTLNLRAVFRPISTVTTYAAWSALQRWTNAGSQSAQNLDPDGDGWTNAAEYAFDMDPLTPDVSPDALDQAGPNIVFRFRRNLRATDISVGARFSRDLATWSSAGLVTRVADFNPDGDFSAQLVEVEAPLAPSPVFFRATTAP